MKNLLMVLAVVSILVSCEATVESDVTTDDKPRINTDGPLKGKVGGASFEAKSGSIKKSFDEYRVSIFESAHEDPCDVFMPQENQVFFTFDGSTGATYLSMQDNITIYDYEHTINLITTEGYYDLLEMGDETAKMKIKASFDNSTYLGGEVTLKVCD